MNHLTVNLQFLYLNESSIHYERVLRENPTYLFCVLRIVSSFLSFSSSTRAMFWSLFVIMKCIEINKIFLFSKFCMSLWAIKVFTRACNVTYSITCANKILLVASEHKKRNILKILQTRKNEKKFWGAMSLLKNVGQLTKIS